MKLPGLYIHIPFCERKCTYCNFNTTDFFEDLAQRYCRAVAREVSHWGRKLVAQPASSFGGLIEQGRPTIDTIYFGGGTPSIVEGANLAAIIDACREAFDVAQEAEVTIEINPGTFSPLKLKVWRDAGINRASVGVQSFIDAELVALSRTHTADDARRTVGALREAGFDNISLDLIAGLPDQSKKDWEFNLGEALRLGPEHLSLYLLEVKEGTRLFGQINRGLRPHPDDDLAAEMYTMMCEATAAAGFEHYEISNFARVAKSGPAAGDFRSKHNMKYWTGAAFYGLGCGAHSYDGRARWVNVMKTESYIDAVETTGEAVAERHELTDQDRAAEALFMGLRLSEGVDVTEFRSEYGVDVIERYRADIDRFQDAGLIEFSRDRMKLTGAGRLLSNEVFAAFV
ncbi:MAG TPA: radical SAM family heme chaperone HemW [Blastocatellia bacterium]|nr:radical SAM family heme chaperone HemW [Blastocatellia bacterium]